MSNLTKLCYLGEILAKFDKIKIFKQNLTKLNHLGETWILKLKQAKFLQKGENEVLEHYYPHQGNGMEIKCKLFLPSIRVTLIS